MARIAETLVIGLGNPYRGDDAAGRIVAAKIRSEAAKNARVIEESGEGAAVMEAWRGAERVIVVDAIESGATPGTIYRFDAGAQPLPNDLFHCSTHALGLAEAVELARTLGLLPPRLTVFAIEGADFSAGEGLSSPVASAIEEVVREVRAELDEGLG